MSEIVVFPSKHKPNKPRPAQHDRAVEVADVLIAEVFRHIWDGSTDDLDLPALSKKIAAILRIEFAHAGRRQ
jgi:hypothetical protein